MEHYKPTATVGSHAAAQKRFNFSEKMNRESVSCSPTEGEKPSRTKVMQSEIKKEDSRSTLCFIFFRHLADFGNLLLR